MTNRTPMATLVAQEKRFAVDAVLLDLDGTLVDTLGDFHAALNGMLSDLALPGIEQQAIEPMVGKGSEHLIDSVLKYVLSLGGADFDAIKIKALRAPAWAAYQRHYAAINGQFARLYPGVRGGVAALVAAGLPMACVTNKPTVFARELLGMLGLGHAMVQVFGGDAFARKKPDPDPLWGACAALGVRPERTLMVGDSANDAQAARAAGCPVVLLTYGYNHGRPVREVDADAWIDSLAELIPCPAARP